MPKLHRHRSLSALFVAAAVVGVGCYGDSLLRVDCADDEDCPTGTRCVHHVCFGVSTNSQTPADTTPEPCPTGLDRCGDDCVDLRREPLHCGECFDRCIGREREEAVCAAGECSRVCDRFFYDINGGDDGCEYACTPTSPSEEVCDGIDNDCDGLVDDEDDSLRLPRCAKQVGVCADARQSCSGGQLRECDDDDYEAQATEPYERGQELRCDGLDNNCDGEIDEHCCAGGATPYERLESAQSLTIGVWDVDGALRHATLHTDTGVITTRTLARFRGSAQTEAHAFEPYCASDSIIDAIALGARRRALVACNEGGAGLFWFDLGTRERGTAITPIDGALARSLSVNEQDGLLAAALNVVDEDGAAFAWLFLDDDAEPPLASRFTPSVDGHGAVAIAVVGDGVAVVHTMPALGELRLQPLDRALTPTGFAAAIDAGDPWEQDRALPLAATNAGDVVWVGFADLNTRDAVRVASWRPPAREATLHEVDLSAPDLSAIRIAPTRGGGALVSALDGSRLRVWELSRDGSLLEAWTLDGFAPRVGATPALPARWRAQTLDGVLTVAVGVPRDVTLDATDGALVYRLGTLSHPLCQ